MPRHPAGRDKYANIMAASMVLAAADTEQFVAMATGISLGVGVGILIDEIDYFNNARVLIIANADRAQLAITTVNTLTDLTDASDRRIIHLVDYGGTLTGTAANMRGWQNPDPFQFFPPLIIASPRIFLGADSQSLGSVFNAACRIYFRFIELGAQEYLEIAETFQITS